MLLVTEHNAEVNAGFIVVFGSWHLPIVTETDSSGITFPRTDARRDKVAEIAQKVNVVALGGTKAMHEFLVLHYFATDSAQGWDEFFDQCLQSRRWMDAPRRCCSHEHV